MPLVATLDSAIDYESWLALNTDYCQRFRCRLTAADCEQQRRVSAGVLSDMRCQDCGGLADQPEAVNHIGNFRQAEAHHLHIVKPVSAATLLPVEELSTETAARISEQATLKAPSDNTLAMELYAVFFQDKAELSTDTVDAAECITDSIDEDDEDQELLSDLFGDAEMEDLDPVMQQLLKAFKSIEEEPVICQEKNYKATSSRYRIRVFEGRCRKCGGYMSHNYRECQGPTIDDEVYRCFNCGWRVSPIYSENRLMAGGNI